MDAVPLELRAYLDDLKASGLLSRGLMIAKLMTTHDIPPERARQIVCNYLGVVAIRKRDNRTPEKRSEDQRAWYLKNQDYVKMRSRLYKQALRNNPLLWAAYLEKARGYKRKKFGWKRIKVHGRVMEVAA